MPAPKDSPDRKIRSEMRMSCNKILGALALFALSTACQAGRPLSTEDASTIDVGKCELESFIGVNHERATPHLTRVSAQWGCGVVAGTQAALALAASRSAGSTDQTLTLGGKTALNQPEDGAPVFLLAYGVNGVHPDGGHWQQDLVYLNGVTTLTAAKNLLVHGNLGASHSRIAKQSTVNWALAVEKIGDAGIDLMAETFGDDRSHRPWFQAGIRWTAIPDRLIVDSSLGVQAAHSHPTALTIGFRLLF
jgi:hypothetical protein